MAYQFRVGQRVRIVSALTKLFIGKTGVIYGISQGGWGPHTLADGVSRDAVGYMIDVDGIGWMHPLYRGGIAFLASDLRPLTAPLFTDFIASLEKLSREPLVPLPEKAAA